MIAYWERDCEWMSEGLQLAICPSFTGPTSLAALDVSGRGNPGTLTNMDRNTAWVTSGGKGALECVPNGFVVASNITARNSASPISLGGWFFAPSAGYNFNNYFLSIPQVSGGANGIDFTNPQAVRFNLFGSGAGDVSINTTVDLRSKWTFLVGVFDGSRGLVYADGTLAAQANHTAGSGTASREFNIGRFGAFGGFTSIISDDVRLYYRALTAPEVRQLYERGRGGGMLHQPVNQRSYYAQLAAAFSILAESGSYALNGHPIPLLYGRAISADTGSVLLSGQTTSLLTSRLLNADQGSYAYSGTDAATLLGRLLDAGAAAYTLDGTAAGFIARRRISADTVAYLASGLDAGFLRSRVLEAGTGQYVLVASPVNITTGTGGAAPYYYYLFLLGGS